MINFRTGKDFEYCKVELLNIIKEFNASGIILVKGKRNSIKLFDFEDKVLNIKSFKKPFFINKIAYKYFRKSKAKRSFEFANRLLELGIGTPQPIAFYENFDFLGLSDSYYVSEHLNCDLTYRDLLKSYPDSENILRQFTQFTFEMHQKGIEFLDHSPGNTLIKKNEDGRYSFYLVDLNRMKFHNEMSLDLRMNNLRRLTPQKEMIAIMSNEYAKLLGEKEHIVFDKMWGVTQEFYYRFNRKKELKRKFLFWKN